MAEPKRTPIDPGLVARLGQAVRYVVSGATTAWMGPNQPLAPVADKPEDQTAGRAMDYMSGVNVTAQPKVPDGGVDYNTLRGFADAYDLVRLCIETRKDQIAAQRWQFKLRNSDETTDGRLAELEAFFKFPDKVNDWETWCRILMEDMLVIDATTLYPRLTNGGQPFAFETMDGAMIKREIDGYGRTPMPPEPAYQQTIKGLPAIDYTLTELVYRPRNLRSYKLYGFSPVEQIVTTINIALRRQLNQLEYFTDGNLPSALIAAPEAWTPDQIKQFQKWYDERISNQSKRVAQFVPGGVNVIDTKQALWGPADGVLNEWLARLVCFCFNVTPTALVATNNRATSDSQKEQAEDEGLKPTKQWLKNLIDYLVVTYFGYADIEFDWVVEKEVDALKQAQIAQIYLAASVVTPDEVRAELGMDPLSAEQLEQIKAMKPAPPMMAPPGQDPGHVNGEPKPVNGAEPKGSGEAPPAAKADQIHIHMPEIKTGDTLVEIGGTVVKVEHADGKVTETWTDGRS